jgi:hypothetical protein
MTGYTGREKDTDLREQEFPTWTMNSKRSKETRRDNGDSKPHKEESQIKVNPSKEKSLLTFLQGINEATCSGINCLHCSCLDGVQSPSLLMIWFKHLDYLAMILMSCSKMQ